MFVCKQKPAYKVRLSRVGSEMYIRVSDSTLLYNFILAALAPRFEEWLN